MLIDPMRHPLLRILVTLLIGLITPLCCCRAMAMVGSGCGGVHAASIESASCCSGCQSDPASEQERNAPPDDHPPAPGKCPSCPSCDGTSPGVAEKADFRWLSLEHKWDARTTLVLPVLWNIPPLHAQAAGRRPAWAFEPPFLKANREALCWQCALMV